MGEFQETIDTFLGEAEGARAFWLCFLVFFLFLLALFSVCVFFYGGGEFVCVLTHGILCVQWTKMLGRMLRLCQPLFPSLSRCVCVCARVKDLSDRIEMEDGDHQRKCMSVFNLH